MLGQWLSRSWAFGDLVLGMRGELLSMGGETGYLYAHKRSPWLSNKNHGAGVEEVHDSHNPIVPPEQQRELGAQETDFRLFLKHLSSQPPREKPLEDACPAKPSISSCTVQVESPASQPSRHHDSCCLASAAFSWVRSCSMICLLQLQRTTPSQYFLSANQTCVATYFLLG